MRYVKQKDKLIWVNQGQRTLSGWKNWTLLIEGGVKVWESLKS